MTAVELLSELRRVGVKVEAEAGQLRTRPAGGVPTGLQPLLVQHRQALLELVERGCPSCGGMDYLRLVAGWRRCWTCGVRWGRGRDPGDPHDLKRVADLLGLEIHEPASPEPAPRRPGWSRGFTLPCPSCGNRPYSTPPGGPPLRRCDGPAGCGHVWNPEAS